jgi:hypothetical protein
MGKPPLVECSGASGARKATIFAIIPWNVEKANPFSAKSIDIRTFCYFSGDSVQQRESVV